ncbi:LysM peptidoglycan-binding domain-containing protein, partial [Enterococcus mundtii]|nr:LysM peptidoglycan-binding domain-containing protein [Enterococcus mundtii]
TPLGNSGMEFATGDEAMAWGQEQVMNPDSQWFGMQPSSKPLMWSNGEILSYSVDFL